MLPLVTVQALAAIGLVATLASLVVGRALRHERAKPARVLAKREPAQWKDAVWILGTAVVVLWPIGVLFSPTYAYDWPALPDLPGSWLVQVLGVLLGGGGGMIFFSAARALGRHLTPAIQVTQDHQLVQDGPYRYIRHPIYTAIVSLAVGQTLFFLSVPFALVALLLAGLANYRARLEEDLLRSPEAFGDTYDDYIARTGRFLPRILSKR